jgi:hypothetical protein
MSTVDTKFGEYADGRRYALPESWEPLQGPVRDYAVAQAMKALREPASTGRSALDRLRSYYDPGGNYAGALMSTIEPNLPDEIGAADLLSVTTLKMEIPAYVTRQLLESSERRRIIHRRLREIPLGLPITALDAEVEEVAVAKRAMCDLYRELRTLMSPLVEGSNRWVFAAKLCARKRPWLFPVRDSKVCEYLALGGKLVRGSGIGQFGNDLQAFAFLMSSSAVSSELSSVRESLETEGFRLDASDLRLLDVVLWTAATGN